LDDRPPASFLRYHGRGISRPLARVSTHKDACPWSFHILSHAPLCENSKRKRPVT